MCDVRSIYSLFSFRYVLKIVVAVLLSFYFLFFQFFSIMPIMFRVKCNIPLGELHLSFLWEYFLWFNVLLSLVCTTSTMMPPPPPSPFFWWTESQNPCDCEKCVLCRDETCSPENSRDNNSQCSRLPGPALRSRKSSRKFPQPPPLCPPCSLGH